MIMTKFTSQLLLCMLLSGTFDFQGKHLVQNIATYTRINTVFT